MVSAHKQKRDTGYSSRYMNTRAEGCMSANANFGESRVRDVTQITGEIIKPISVKEQGAYMITESLLFLKNTIACVEARCY